MTEHASHLLDLVPGLRGDQYLDEEMDAYMKKSTMSVWFGSFLALKTLCGAESLLQSLGYVIKALPTTFYLASTTCPERRLLLWSPSG